MHGWKYLTFGPDGLLYSAIGAPGNILDRGDPYATIIRMKPEPNTQWEIFARGVRNTVGYTWHPDTREMWFTDNGRDTLGDDTPNDELNVAAKAGLHFGYPYCHQGETLDPEFGKGKNCADYVAPAQNLGPHVAGLGLKFYGGTMFPQDYRKQLIVVNHGSWNRSPQVSHTGYRLMLAKVQNNKVTSYEPFVEGWLQAAPGSEIKRQAWGQPVDLLELPDGSLLVSDDRANVIYRITYRTKKRQRTKTRRHEENNSCFSSSLRVFVVAFQCTPRDICSDAGSAPRRRIAFSHISSAGVLKMSSRSTSLSSHAEASVPTRAGPGPQPE